MGKGCLGKRGAPALLNVKHRQGVPPSLSRLACWRLFQAGEELWMSFWRWHNATGKLCQARKHFLLCLAFSYLIWCGRSGIRVSAYV